MALRGSTTLVIGAAVLWAAAAGCAPGAVPAPVSPAAVESAPDNEPPPEATAANAGGTRCRLGAPVEIGSIAKGGAFSLGFGERGGLVVWASPEGIRARPLNAHGRLAGDEIALALPRDSAPAEVVPAGRGFVVIAPRPARVKASCEGQCADPLCVSPAGAHVCSYPCLRPCEKIVGTDVFLQPTDEMGRAIGVAAAPRLGLITIEAVIQGEPRRFGLVTGGELVMVEVRSDDRIETTITALPRADFVLPVRGSGPTSMLLLNDDASMRILDAGGVRAVQGNLFDAQSGRVIDARLQARWGPDGRIHVARQAWMIARDAIQYATIEGLALRFDGPEERGFRAPFAEYVEPRREGSRWKRGSWLQRTVGDDIDLRDADPHADATRARVYWTGKAFAFAYRVEPAGALRVIAADCSGEERSER